MEKGRIAAHWPNSADAADFFEGSTPEERTLIDYCRTPFSFGLILWIPVVLMITAFVLILNSRATLTKRFAYPPQQGMLYEEVLRDAGPGVTPARRARP